MMALFSFFLSVVCANINMKKRSSSFIISSDYPTLLKTESSSCVQLGAGLQLIPTTELEMGTILHLIPQGGLTEDQITSLSPII